MRATSISGERSYGEIEAFNDGDDEGGKNGWAEKAMRY
jgi:hypothetical protein